jgi:hypothetical protein
MYRKGDFVMLKNINDVKVERTLNPTLNIFEIKEVLPTGFVLEGMNGAVIKNDIMSISINGEDDRWVYYDPIVAASTVRPGDPIPIHTRDYTYYFDAFARSYNEDGKTFQQIIREKGFKFVHEVQHYLSDEFHQHHALMINYSKVS